MSSILLEPIIPNLTKVGASGEQLRDLWKLFTKVKDCTQGGRRLENLYWRLWYQSSSTGQLKETEKISSLFETWRGPGEDFKHTSSSSSSSSSRTSSMCSGSGQELPDESPAAVVAASTTTTTTTLPQTPAIQISRVSSALKAVGAAAAAAAPAPATELNIPAVPVSILPKKSAVDKANGMTPSKLSVGFFSEVKTHSAPGLTAVAPPQKLSATVSAAVGAAAAPAPLLSETLSAPRPRASTANFVTEPRAAATTARKKFFINSLSSVSSEESLDEIMNNPRPPAFDTATSTRPNNPNSNNFFSKVIPPEQPLAPEVPLKNPACPSNLSSLLKNPRRPPARNMNILSTAHYYRRRDADYSSQFLESESLKRCLQIDHKPLIDPSLAYGGDTPMTYSEQPAAW